ncbi:hypothetical protein ACLB2K_001454 [Fragaria x ananassa]
MEGVRSVISEEINQDLMAPVLEEEVRVAIFQLGALKAPGPDGFPGIISVNQNAFVPGRLIQDNILLAHETYHYLKLKREGGKHELALKLDMVKAYDHVEWDFLEAALVRFGFSRDWIRLIVTYVTTVSFAIVLNGKPGRIFCPSQGLRQGDPISPYLFLLVSEVLSLCLTKCVGDGSLIGIRLSRGDLIMSHLFFADDALFFIRATLGNVSRLSIIFKDYCTASGQAISQDKSSIFFSPNSPEQMVFLLCELLGFDCVDDPGVETCGEPYLFMGRGPKVSLIDWKRKVWNLSGILGSIGREVAEQIQAMPIGEIDGQDRLIWPHDNFLYNGASLSPVSTIAAACGMHSEILAANRRPPIEPPDPGSNLPSLVH